FEPLLGTDAVFRPNAGRSPDEGGARRQRCLDSSKSSDDSEECSMRPNNFLLTNLPPVLDGLGSTETLELEERCRDYLVSLRWPEGVACPRCEESRRLLWLEARSKGHCYPCRYQFSVTAQPLFHNSHLPLSKWFLGVHLFVE